jgi:hypothetical protein
MKNKGSGNTIFILDGAIIAISFHYAEFIVSIFKHSEILQAIISENQGNKGGRPPF